jgi:hypothetical protein
MWADVFIAIGVCPACASALLLPLLLAVGLAPPSGSRQ